MKKRIHLKRSQTKKYKMRFLGIIIILAIIVSYLLIDNIGKAISDKLQDYALVETEKIAKYVVNYAIASDSIKNIKTDELFITLKNKNDEIQTIDFDTTVLNGILSEVTMTVIEYFKSVENGELDKINISESSLVNISLNKLKKGIVTEVPMGIATGNAFLANLGPKFPVRLSLSGEIESYVDTKIESFGINNTVLTVFINIKVSQLVYMPFSTKRITVEQRTPIAIKVMQGVVPNCYFGNLNSTSSLIESTVK